MRFNKQELLTLATQPSQKFEKEGILYVRERQEGFFRRTESTGRKSNNKCQKGKTHKTLRDFSCVTASTSKVWRDGAGCGGTYYFISNRGTNGRNH